MSSIARRLAPLAAWTPLAVAPLAWWDADDTLRLATSGGAVTSWTDRIGGLAAVQATGAARPTLVTTGNGRRALRFDGLAQFLSVEAQPFPSGANACELWVLADQQALVTDTGSRSAFAFGGNASATARGIRRIVSGSTNYAAAVVGTGAGATTVLGPTSTWLGRSVVRAEIGATSTTVRKDGTAGSATGAVPSTGTSRIRIGAATTDTAAAFWQGDILAILVTPILAAADASKLRAWLNRRV